MARTFKPWPTPTIPRAPVSVATHGPVSQWTDEQWALWQAWAGNLKHYPGEAPGRQEISDNADSKTTGD